METIQEKEELIDGCCPKFYPEKWDEKTFKWEGKQFIKESVLEFFHIPYPPMIKKKITKMMRLAEAADRMEANKGDALLLFADPSPFKGDIYLSVTGSVPDANNTNLSGTFISKVFEGDYGSIPKFIKQMDTYLDNQHKKARNYYVHYAYCPKCAEKEKHNYTVLFAQV